MTVEGPRYGIVDRDAGTVTLLADRAHLPSLPLVPDLGDETVPLAEAELLAPVDPGKIVVIGRNYGGSPDDPGTLMIHLKPPTAVIGPGESIVLPGQSQDVRYEGELAVVIGRTCRSVDSESAAAHVLGYTCANDLTAWDIGTDGGQWTKAKGMDTFCPLGPWISTGIDPAAARITTRINGEVRQDGSTARLTRSTAVLVSEVSRLMTLLPGDVLLTGTPEGGAALAPGDRVEIGIDGIGTLVNPVVASGAEPDRDEETRRRR
ncbi:fumarylacetoacetate hydrolase family protein [Streptomyces sp. NPDC050617]|uniref:fumarylacetoacetate hydrolase family protein n=1 Tax=Streptomyces sp. NPDC050617 TaxID=3154628 RepID=UPI00342AD65A